MVQWEWVLSGVQLFHHIVSEMLLTTLGDMEKTFSSYDTIC